MRLYYPIEVDLYKPYPLPVMEAQQNNIGRGAVVTLKANGAIIQPTNEGLTFWAKKPDGTVSFLAATLTGNNIQMDFTNQMLALPGMVQVEIRLTSGSGESETDISTPIFSVRVNPSNINDSAVESQNEFTALQVAIGEVQSALSEVDELKKNGLKGDPGQAATVDVGTVTASEPGGAPSVTNAGTEQAAILDFVLPRGEQGPKGNDGAAGKDGKEQIVFAAASAFPTTGDPAMLYVDNTVSPAIIYTWSGSTYVQASADISTVMSMLATPFSETESYTTGKYVTYNGQYWRFTADKTAGAWDAIKAEATNIGAELSALNIKIIPVTFLDIMNDSYVRLYQSGERITGMLFAVNDTPKNRISVKANVITGIGNASSSNTYYFVPVASVSGNPFGLTANQYTCVGTSLDRATSSSGTLSVVPGLALALYNGTDTLLYCSVGGGSTTYASTKYLIWIDYVLN